MRKQSLYFRVLFRVIYALILALNLIWFYPANLSADFVFNASTVGAVGVIPATEIDALTGHWIQTTGPPTWQVRALVVKGDYVFAGGRGAWRFSNNGGVWNPINRGLPAGSFLTITSFAITDAGASIFAGTERDGVFRSTDNGDNWTPSSDGLPQFTVVNDIVVAGSNLFLATGSGVYLSTNNGENWTPVNNGLPSLRHIFALTVGGNNLFASTIAGVYRSGDNGTHWVSVGNGLPVGIALGTLTAVGSNIFAGTVIGVYLSTDAGANWARSSNGLPQDARVVTLFAGGGTIYAGLEEGMIYRSTDDGANWNAVSEGLTKTSINAMAARETSLFAATSSGVFTSNNNAASWIEAQSGAVESRIRTFTASGALLLSGTESGLFISDDNGVTWRDAGDSLPRLDIPSIAVDGTNLFAAVIDTSIIQGGVYRSMDNGATWTKTIAGLPRGEAVEALAASSGNLFACVRNNGVYISNDNGNNWRSAGFPSSTSCRSLSIVDSSIYAGTENGIYVTTDAGSNWTAVGGGLPSGHVISIIPNGNSLIAVTESNGLYRSTDDGATWTEFNGTGFFNRLPKGTRDFIAIGSDLIASISGGRIFVSSDNGANWMTSNSELMNTVVRRLFISGDKLLAGTDGSGVFLFYNSARQLASVSAASYAPDTALASESIAAAFGQSLATTSQIAATNPPPILLSGTSIRVRDSMGVERVAPLFSVSPHQVKYMIPEGTAAGMAIVTLISGTGEVSTGSIQIAQVAPGLFSANDNGKGVAAAVVVRVMANGKRRVEPVARFDYVQNKFIAIPIDFGPDMGRASDQIFLSLFGTGIRFRSSLAAVSANVGGVSLPAEYAGLAPGFFGLDQINVRLTRNLVGRGDVNVLLTVDGVATNAVQINVR
jgi:uncharacterized protein (TIGR03437 family)